MSISTANLYQRAALWELSSFDDNGDPLVLDSVCIPCRWDDSQKEVRGPDGIPISVTGTVLVGRDIPQGSLLKLLAQDESGTAIPLPTTGVSEVISFDATPDLSGRNPQRMVMLQRYN